MDLHNISIFSSLLSIACFCIFRHNWIQRQKWAIFILCIVSFAVDLICKKWAEVGLPTIWVNNLFTLIEGELLFFFFLLLFSGNKKLKTTAATIAISFLLLWTAKNFVWDNIHVYDYFSQTVEFILLLVLCLLYFFLNATVTDTTFIYSYYQFWIVSALLMYCAGTFFSFFTPIPSANETKLDTHLFEIITRSSSILKNILFTIAFYISNKATSNHSKNLNSIYYFNELKD